eukprot:7299853-Pyramimonas_sp.AAC.1
MLCRAAGGTGAIGATLRITSDSLRFARFAASQFCSKGISICGRVNSQCGAVNSQCGGDWG